MSSRRVHLLLLTLTFLIATTAFAADRTREFAPVQIGFVDRGEDVLPYAPDRVLVKIAPTGLKSLTAVPIERGAKIPGASFGLAGVDAIARAAGVTSIERPFDAPARLDKASSDLESWYMMRVAPGDMEALATRLAADPDVVAATPDWRAFPAATPNDPMFADNWGHNNTAQLPDLDWGGTYEHTLPNTVGTVGFDANAKPAWDASQGYGSSGMVIAILDSGVDVGHPDLNQVTGYDYGDNDSNPDDDSSSPGHGTACAGVAAGIANNGIGVAGIAGGCKIMPLKVANSAGSMYFSSIVNAIYYAADNGADIISMSFSADISNDANTDAAIQYAYNAGLVLAAATSNSNQSHIHYPANNTYVMGIGAASPCGDRKRSSSLSSECNPGVSTDPNGYTCDGERWWGSNYGVSTADAAGAVDVLGPTILPTTDIQGSGGYDNGDYSGFFNGTSCATPYVAGVAALVKSKNPGWTNAQIRDQICNTAIDITNVESGAGFDRYSGYGMVDAEAAVGGGGPVEDPPVAAFGGMPTDGTAPLDVSFTDASSNSPTNWSWNFGDGGNSTAQNPNHTYTSAGTYTVTLTATNAYGSDDEVKTNYITVTTPPAPVAAFSGTPTSGYSPLDVSFTDQSANGPTSWSWNFGDGGNSTAQNPNHTYTTAGTYTVTLTAINASGSDDEIKTNYITVQEPGSLYASLPFSEGFETGSLGGNWTSASNNNGRIRIATSNTPHGGSYHMLMDCSSNGTYSTNEAWLHLDLAGESQVDLSFWWKDFSDETHSGDGVYFSDNGGSSFTKVQDLNGASYSNNVWREWDLDVDALAAANGLSLSSTFVVKFQQYDNYMITTDGMAFDDISVTAGAAGSAPTAAFSGTPTSGTAPLAVSFTDASTDAPTSWSWTFGDGGTSTARNPNHTYTAAGDYTVSLTAANAYGSDGETKTNYITVTEPSGGGDWVEITYDDFEGGFGNYTDGGGDCYLYTGGSRAHQGSNAAGIQDNSGTASSFYHTAGYNVSSYVELEVDFWFYAYSMDNTREDFWLQYYDGSSWQTIETWARTTDFNNNTFYHETVTIPNTYNFPANAKLRFMCDASGNRDDVYIDEIKWSGLTAGGAVAMMEKVLPQVFAARQNYPNPFNPLTKISFDLPRAEFVKIDVFDIRGARVETLVAREYAAGTHIVEWYARGVASGTYFYRVQAGKYTATKRMTLIK